MNAPTSDEIRIASKPVDDSINEIELAVPGMHCGGCITRIEKALQSVSGIISARVNLTNKRVAVRWVNNTDPSVITSCLAELGFDSVLPVNQSRAKDEVLAAYLKAIAVAGFASANIMLLSVAVWSGADRSTTLLFNWISALIAIPALFYSGRVFFRSAWHSVKSRKTNMDVPISIGIIVTCLLSLYDTITGREEVFFEAAAMLVFFLLIGRTLDHMMRRRAETVVDSLQSLEPAGVEKQLSDGSTKFTRTADLLPGDIILVDSQSRVPADGVVVKGVSSVNTELVNGESLPSTAKNQTKVLAGTLNLTAPLSVRVTARADDSFLASIQTLVRYGEGKKGSYRQLADRVSAVYAPVVHIAALVAFLFWLLRTYDLHHAISVAIAVLIITCPCALALAIPMVQTIAAQRLLSLGVVMKNGAALEKMQSVDTVLFDKTGVLTESVLTIGNGSRFDHHTLLLAGMLAEQSPHPFARAITEYQLQSDDQNNSQQLPLALTNIKEVAGYGIEAQLGTDQVRLGKRSWATNNDAAVTTRQKGRSECVLGRNGETVAEFFFYTPLRANATDAINLLHEHGQRTAIVSGDNPMQVNRLAAKLHIKDATAGCSPDEKLQIVEKHIDSGSTVLMVGDGLNDSAAMAKASVSMAPGCASSVSRTLADFVFLRNSLAAIPTTVQLSKTAAKLVKQNFAIAVIYNLVALPFAFSGAVTPLFAALAMSTSSLLVVANSLRIAGAGSESELENHQPQRVFAT